MDDKSLKYFEECGKTRGQNDVYFDRKTQENVILKNPCNKPYCIECANRGKSKIATASILDFRALKTHHNVDVLSLDITFPDEIAQILSPTLTIEHLRKTGYKGEESTSVIKIIIERINKILCRLYGFPEKSNLACNIAIHYVRKGNFFKLATHFHCLIQLIATIPKTNLSKKDERMLEEQRALSHFENTSDILINRTHTFDAESFNDLFLKEINQLFGTKLEYIVEPNFKFLDIDDEEESKSLEHITRYNHYLPINRLLDSVIGVGKDKNGNNVAVFYRDTEDKEKYLTIPLEQVVKWWMLIYSTKNKSVGYTKKGLYTKMKSYKQASPSSSEDYTNSLEYLGKFDCEEILEGKKKRIVLSDQEKIVNHCQKISIRPLTKKAIESIKVEFDVREASSSVFKSGTRKAV